VSDKKNKREYITFSEIKFVADLVENGADEDGWYDIKKLRVKNNVVNDDARNRIRVNAHRLKKVGILEKKKGMGAMGKYKITDHGFKVLDDAYKQTFEKITIALIQKWQKQ
jgi:hypothetical protein